MTQLLADRSFSLRRAPLSIRVMITAFMMTVAVAVAVGVVNYRLRTGLVPSGSALWYRGGAAAGGEALFGKTPLELLDATHPHLFGQAFLFFVLCHVFALVPAGERLRITLYIGAFGSVLVDAAAPWLIRYVSPAFALLQVANTWVMVAVFLLLLALPLREMWLPRRRIGS